MKKFLTLLVSLLLGVNLIFAQNVGINSDGSAPNASAMLDVKSSTKGFLVPRMLSTERTAINPAATGLLVYQTDAPAGFYYYTGSAWTLLGTGSGNGTVTSVATGTGLTGGPVTTTGTIALANTSVTAGSYTRATITVDAQGRITAAGDGAAVSLTAGVSGVLPIANGGTNASTANEARTNLGASTLGGNMFTLTNPSAITFPRFNANNTISSLTAAEFRTAIGAGTGSSSGTVTNVSAGNGMNFTAITGSGSVILGTPSTLTNATTNAVTTTSHTHAITTQLPSSATAGVMLQSGSKAAGGFYGGTTAPSSTTRANYDGYLYATRFYGDGSQLTGITATGYSGTLPVANGGTGTTTGSITGTGALTFAAGGTNTNVTLTPNGTGFVDITGGNGTTKKLNITDASTADNSASLLINKTGAITGAGYGVIANVSGATNNYGLSGTATGTGTYNYGVYGNSTGAATVNYGVYGNASGGTANYGVFGFASGATGTTSRAGVFLNQSTITYTKYGSFSSATGVSSGTNIGGYFTATGSTTANYGLIVDGGNMGIGTTTPSDKLVIVDATTQGNSISISKTGAAVNSNGIDITVNGGTGWNRGISIRANGTSTAGNYGVYCMTTGASTGTNYGGYFSASNATNANYALVTDAGNVGFGTLTPGYQLDVAGDVNLTGVLRVNGAAGTAGQYLKSNGANDPTWADVTATTATTATNIAGGSAGTIPYQSAAGTTSQLAAGTSGYILKSNGAAAPAWLSTLPVANGGTGATTLTGYVKGTGTTSMTASATIPAADISGNITGNAANVTGTVAVANGGTGATTVAAARTALGAAASGTNTDITSLGGLTTDITVAQGGTGTSTGSITGTGALTFTAGGTNQNVTLTPSGTGDLVMNGYTRLGGATAPAIKYAKYSGTTASTLYGVVSITHGLDVTKILSYSGMVNCGGSYFQLNLADAAYWDSYRTSSYISSTVINVVNIGSLTLSRPFTVTIMYEE